MRHAVHSIGDTSLQHPAPIMGMDCLRAGEEAGADPSSLGAEREHCITALFGSRMAGAEVPHRARCPGECRPRII